MAPRFVRPIVDWVQSDRNVVLLAFLCATLPYTNSLFGDLTYDDKVRLPCGDAQPVPHA